MSVVSGGVETLSLGFGQAALHAMHCLSEPLFLIRHSLHSQLDAGVAILLIELKDSVSHALFASVLELNMLVVLSVCAVSEDNPKFDCVITLDSVLFNLGHNMSRTLPDFSP